MPHELHIIVPGHPAPLRTTETLRIGRAATNDIVIDQTVVSTHHCILRPLADGWEVADLGSTNGTFVDGQRVSAIELPASATLRLGNSGPILQLTIPTLAQRGSTYALQPDEIVDRVFATVAPQNMSPHTEMMRAAVQERRVQEATTWKHRIQRYRAGLGVLALIAIGAGITAYVQARRAEAVRQTAASIFTTMKELELDIRRIEATAGPNPAIREKRARLEKQYEDMVKTLGIYSDKTPPDEQLIYRTIHHLGESEANVPRGFVRDVHQYIERWKKGDFKEGYSRAELQGLGSLIGPILLKHNLPREFFYLPMQESRYNVRAIGPVTYAGIPKGMWQFTPGTAESYGLHIGPLRGERVFDSGDDRHNARKASEAAARYLEDLYTTDAQLSGLLVVASYNMGEGRMRRLIRSLPESPSERNLWKLLETRRKDIPSESYDYMFRVFSAAVIGANPRLFGFDFDPVVKGEEGEAVTKE